jgi:hypothetical protein
MVLQLWCVAHSSYPCRTSENKWTLRSAIGIGGDLHGKGPSCFHYAVHTIEKVFDRSKGYGISLTDCSSHSVFFSDWFIL